MDELGPVLTLIGVAWVIFVGIPKWANFIEDEELKSEHPAVYDTSRRERTRKRRKPKRVVRYRDYRDEDDDEEEWD